VEHFANSNEEVTSVNTCLVAALSHKETNVAEDAKIVQLQMDDEKLQRQKAEDANVLSIVKDIQSMQRLHSRVLAD
jgi:cell division protein FtsB